MSLLDFPKGSYVIVRIDGSTEAVEGKPNVTVIANCIGTRLLDQVSVGRANNSDVIMFVDDNGYDVRIVHHADSTEIIPTTPRKPVNPEATKLYHAVCKPGTTHQIVGDVVLAHDKDFE